MKKQINILMLIIVLLILTTINIFAENMNMEDLEVFLNGETLNIENEITFKNGKIYLPLRKIVEKLGYEIEYIKDLDQIKIVKDEEIINIQKNKNSDIFISKGITRISLNDLEEILNLNIVNFNNSIYLDKYEKIDINEVGKDLGFKVDLPESWKDKYILQIDDNIIYVLHDFDKNERKGMLFSIERVVGELITEEDILESYIPQKLLGKNNGYSYIRILPSDVQYDVNDKEEMESFLNLWKDIDLIEDSFKTVNIDKPKAKKEGYKVIGSNFFKIEVLENWDIEKSKTNEFIWLIKEDNKIIGEIELLSKNEEEKEYNEMNSEYLKSKDINRKFRISLINKKNIYMKDILNSFEDLISGYTTKDYIGDLEEYIDYGGYKKIGKIEEIKWDGNLVKDIVINFDGKIKTYNSDVINMVKMENKKYKLYGTEAFIRKFIEEDNDFYNKLYEFTISKSGKIKGIVEVLDDFDNLDI